jgi:DNA-binding transcriptional regulator of glucitol operon
MAATAGHPRPRWFILLRPRWLAWHLFAVVATLGMLWLGDWQLHRAESGNELSWAYTFEWPLFAIFGVYFWAKTLRDELRSHATAGAHPGPAMTAESAAAESDPHIVVNPAAGSETAEAAAAAYVERLKAEVRSHGKWHGWR